MKLQVLLLPVFVTAAVLAIACKSGDTIVQTSSQNLSGVSATGTGKAIGEPDIALISVGVHVQRPTVEQARDDAAAAQKAVVDSLKGNGVKDEDIQTVQFSVSPEYDSGRNGTTPSIIGYVVNNVVSAKVRNLDTTGKVIDDATRAGGNDAVVQGVSFTIDDPEELKAQAREQAVKKAQAQARQLADASGNKLGKLLSISEEGGAIPYQNLPVASAARDAAAETPIEAGQLEVNVSVSLLYAIE